MSNILLTGATGFIGRALTDSDKTLKVVVREGHPKYFSNEYRIPELNAETNWGGAFDGIKTIIHLAGLAHSSKHSADDYFSVNVLGTINLAKQAAKAGVRRFVFVSSIGVHGSKTCGNALSETSPVNPHNDYAQSKLDTELELRNISRESDIELVIVRPTLVYGLDAPGSFGKLVSLVKKLPALPFGSITNKRSFIGVNNLADLLLTCCSHPNAAGEIFIASEPGYLSTKEFSNAIASGVRKKIFQIPIPTVVMKVGGKLFRKSSLVDQLVGDLEVDSRKSFELLDWTPPFTLLQEMKLLRKE